MNTRIEKDFSFQCGLHYDDQYYIINYDITLSMLVETYSISEQNVAMYRVIHYITEVIQNSVLINSKHTNQINLYKAANMKICELPEEPHDQVIGMILLLKLNSIMEGRMQITDMVLASSLSDGVRHIIVAEVAESSFDSNHWWNTSDTYINDNELKRYSGDNVVRLFNDDQWSELDLNWKEI